MRQSVVDTLYKRGLAKICNCAKCGKELLGMSHATEVEMDRKLGNESKLAPPLMAGRINGRPICAECAN